jgi:hypothetical protein
MVPACRATRVRCSRSSVSVTSGALLSHFDLWPFDDVRANAEAILGQRGGGNTSGDDAWPDEQVELFRAWIADGTPA